MLFYLGQSQQKEIDSLKDVIKMEKSDTSRVTLMNELAFLYHMSKPDTTLILGYQALKIAQRTNYIHGQADSYNTIGNALSSKSIYPKALKNHIASIKLWEDLENYYKIAISNNNIGYIYFQLGEYQKALQFYLIALRSIDNGQKLGFKAVLSSNIAENYLKLKMLDSAQTYALQAYNFALHQNDKYPLRASSLILGDTHFDLSNPGIALEYYRKSFESQIPDLITTQSAIGMAKIFKQRKKVDSSIYYAKYSYDLASSIGSMPNLQKSSKFLAEHFKALKKKDSALNYFETSLTAKDSLYNLEQRNKLQALTIKENKRQQQIRTASLEAEKKKKRNLQYLGITVGIASFILVFIILSRSIIIGEKWLRFLGLLILLFVFEFINLYLAPIILESTNNSPILTLLIMVGVAGFLVPLHSKIETYVNKKLVKKNRAIKLAAAKKTIERLESQE